MGKRSASERALHRHQAQHDIEARASRTVWVGGIPDPSASEQGIRALLRRCGDLASVHVRRKPGGSKNWCLVMFRTSHDAKATCDETYRIKHGANATIGWNVKMVDPSKLHSLEAQFTATGVQVDHARELSVAGSRESVQDPAGVYLPEVTSRLHPHPPSVPKPHGSAPGSSRQQVSLEEKLNQYQDQQVQMDELRAQDADSIRMSKSSGRDKRRNIDHQIVARAWNCLQLDGSERVAESMADLLRWAKQVDLFRGLDQKSLTKILRRAKWINAKPGEVLVTLGSPCTQLYLVMTGELEVSLPQVVNQTSGAARSVLDSIKFSLTKRKLDALGMMKDSSRAQHKLWSAEVAKNLGAKWKAKALQRVANAREAATIPVAIGVMEHACRDKCISECQRLLDTDSDDPAVATAAAKAGPRCANVSVRVTKPSRLMVLDHMKDVVAIGRAVAAAQQDNFEQLYRFKGFENCSCEAMHAIAQKLTLRKVKDGETLFAEGDTAKHHYFVLSGRFSCIKKREDGIRNVVGYAGVGAVLGPYPELQEVRQATAVAVAETEVLVAHTYNLQSALQAEPIIFVDAMDTLIADPIAATKSKKENSSNESDEQTESDSSYQIIRRRKKKMQLAVPTTVMAGSLGYSKAAQYTTISRIDIAGAREKAKTSVAQFGLETNWGASSFKERKQSDLRSPREPAGGAAASVVPSRLVKKASTFDPSPRLPAIGSGRGTQSSRGAL